MDKNNKRIKLRIGGVPEHFNLPWRLTIESGALQQFDVDASWTDFPSGTGQMVRALNNAEVDIATLLTEGAIKAIASGNANFEIFSFYTKSPLIWGIHVPASSDLYTLDDLKRATYAISRFGSGSNLMAYLLAESLGHSIDDLQFAIVNNLEGARELFREGGNFAFLWEKFMTKPYVDNGEMRHIADFPTPWSCFVTCVRKEIMDEYRWHAAKIMQCVLDSAQELKQSPIAHKLIAANYGLQLNDVSTWFAATDWETALNLHNDTLESIRKKLTSLKIIQV